jgi:hypothetical protein
MECVYLSTVYHVQFEQYNVRVFQLLDLTSEQRAACADLWRRWVQTRQMLHDRQAALAHSVYTMLPGLPDILHRFWLYWAPGVGVIYVLMTDLGHLLSIAQLAAVVVMSGHVG